MNEQKKNGGLSGREFKFHFSILYFPVILKNFLLQ